MEDLAFLCGTRQDPLDVVIDTDPAMMVRGGLDIDDDLALLFALGSPEIRIRGITITYGNTSLGRACRDAVRLLDLAGRADIPVLRGAGWCSRECTRPTAASRFIVEQARALDGKLVIVTLGPLTNLAAALYAAPDLAARLRGHLALGGRSTPGRFEFNFSAHPDAVNRVLSAPVPRAVVPIETCMGVRFTRRELARVEASPGTVLHALRGHVDRFLRTRERLRHLLFFKRTPFPADGFHPWDVVATAFLVRPGLFSRVERRRMWMEGRRVMITGTSGNPAGGEALVALSAKAEPLLAFILERMLSVRLAAAPAVR